MIHEGVAQLVGHVARDVFDHECEEGVPAVEARRPGGELGLGEGGLR